MNQTLIHPIEVRFAASSKDDLSEPNLTVYATDAALAMEFGSAKELRDSVHRAMAICNVVGIPIRRNFEHIYKCYEEGIADDWKLSELAYQMVCISGSVSNFNVSNLIIQLLQNKNIK